MKFSSFILSFLVFCNSLALKAQQKTFQKGPDVFDTTGNLYHSIITSCGQTWTASNLNTKQYRNGDEIPQIKDMFQWQNLTTGAWCWYLNDSATYWRYGKLYNWYAINDPRSLAPLGWHISTREDWINHLKCLDPSADSLMGFSTNSGGALKDTGTLVWVNPNSGATNYSGFAGLPGGCRNFNGSFSFIGYFGHWWTIDSWGGFGWSYLLYYDLSYATPEYNSFNNGFSVRLVKD